MTLIIPKRLPFGFAGGLLSLALHGLLFVPLLLGGTGPGSGAGALRGSAHRLLAKNSAMTWVAVTEPASSSDLHDSLTAPARLPPPHLEPPQSPVLEVSFDAQGLEAAAAPTQPEPVESDPVLAYVQQVGALTARIQKGWTLPRDRLAADFHCQVRIREGATGSVEEVEFESCDDVESVRASLLRAIEHAAPLPQLTDNHETGKAITLHFAAYAAPTDGRHTVVEPGAGAR